MSITIRSFNQILGDMIRKIVAETPLNDINAGSVLLSLLEACATNDFENNAAILNVLELLNIDAIRNNDLDARAGDYGLTRRPSIRASGQVSILNSTITKRTTGLYVIKPAPIAGQTTLYVNNTNGWSPTGSVYVGRGTDSFEGPIPYTAITVFPTYSAITLSSALQKDHLISDSVIDSQGQPDRLISAGTVVKIPANNQNPEVQYTILRDAVLAAGEDRVTGIDVTALVPGSIGNATINTITQFDTVPFLGATVTNTSSFSNGKDVETDTELRDRVKSYSLTLARGTAPSILSAVVGVSDPDDAKQVASAVITEPVKVGDPSLMYIDDGSGFQPSYVGQSVDRLLNNAEGKEEFLQLANYPIPRPQVVNVAEGPFALVDGSSISVIVDGEEETIEFASRHFLNISAATVAEIIIAINDSSELFKARFDNNSANILLYPVAHDAEIIQVAPLKSTDNPTLYVNSILKFPTNEFSYISLYQNSTKLNEKAKKASLTTSIYSSWNITAAGNIIIAVDGTPVQDRSFALSDFEGASSFASLTLEQWAEAFNKKFAGLTAEATPSQTMKISSNRDGEDSSILVTGGSYLNKWFIDGVLFSQGQSAQFQLNRQTGNLRILTDIVAGDTISAGVEDAKGFVVSTSTTSGSFNVSSDTAGRPAEIVVVVDAERCVQRSLNLLIGATVTVTDQGGSVMRLTANTNSMFVNLIPGDFVYVTKKTAGWLSAANCGLYKVIAKGEHITAGTDSYIEVLNNAIVAETATVSDSTDIKAFVTDGYPQIWRGTYVNNPPAEPINGIVASLNKDLLGVKASIFRSNSIKITSATENGGSIAVPVVIGAAAQVFTETEVEQEGNPSHVANRVSDKSLYSFIKRGVASVANVWLGRDIASEVKGSLTADSVPDQAPFSGTYSEVIQATGQLTAANVDYDDLISFTKGDNKGQIRSVKALIAGDQVGTQQDTARTEFDHIAGDQYQVVRSLQLSSDDSIVVVVDKDATVKTVDIKMARTGRVNSGSASASFIPTNTEFSANDYDNEPNVDFASPTVWDTVINGTNFADYSIWMRARNWYASGGVGSGQGAMLVRSFQYGPNGNKLRFNIDYPTNPGQAATTVYANNPSYSQLSYYFGAGLARATAISDGDLISVYGPYPDATTQFPAGITTSGDHYDYEFSSGSLASVVVGDIMSILPTSGISTYNRGQFRVLAKAGNIVRVINENASVTTPGAPETTLVTTIADTLGSPTVYQVTAVADTAGSLNGTYFIIRDTFGSVAVWFDLNNAGTPEPTHGADRSIKIATIFTGDTATTVASKIYAYLLQDGRFSVTAIGAVLNITNVQNGALAAGSTGTSGFTVTSTTGVNNQSLDGKYFTIYDDEGSVAIWLDVGDKGTIEPFHGAQRSIRVATIQPGNSSTIVAAAIANTINQDSRFTASSTGSQITITTVFDGNTGNATAGTSGFSVSVTSGSLPTSEPIVNSGGVFFFPLAGTAVSAICTTVNDTDVFRLVPIGNPALTITKSTKDDLYTYAGNSTALAYNHTPSIDYISMFDGENWVKSFQNANPNFTLKTAMTLANVSAIYSMNTCPNDEITDLGELFKLIPTTVKNVHHHLTQKALSQLPIVSDIDVSNAGKNVQIKSKQLGSEGAIEVIGGSANRVKLYTSGESEVATDGSGSYLLVKTAAYPDSFNVGDYVRFENDAGVKRLNRLSTTDRINVNNVSTGVMEYNYAPKATAFSAATQFTITDISATYGRPATTVWRWTHNGGAATLASVVAGDLLVPFGTLTGWAQGNKSLRTGDGQVSGFPIIAVNDVANWIDVVNPYGRAMSATTIGASSTVQICPTPIIKWNLAHASRVTAVSIIRASNLVTVTCSDPHFLNTGDNIELRDSDMIPDGIYSSITTLSVNSFRFTLAGADFSEGSVNATIIKAARTPSRYKIEKLGFNGLARISVVDGQSPRFVDCGVALDDQLVLGGSSFRTNNNGRFRVIAVDNNSIVYINDQVSEELNTVLAFNNKGISAGWTANSNLVLGSAGTFKNVKVGDWVKKAEDDESLYIQVVSFNTGDPATAVQMVLGGNYGGSSATAAGVTFDMNSGHNTGVFLAAQDDITIFEGDSAVAGDLLSIQNIIDANWFSVNNIGNFVISEVGFTGTTQVPFVRINNVSGVTEANRLMSVNVNGFYITEALANKFYTIRQVTNVALDDLNPEKRAIYSSPSSRSYKFSEANATTISHVGKLGYNTDVTTGIDGYLYYTGLLRRVQRIIDGYEPDADNFPGRRAVGGLIEILPPLIKRINVSVDVTTNEGVNLGDISNNIKSAIITYIQGLNVGEDVILSEMIAAVMAIKGVGAVTFTNPVPSTERITIADNEKATIVPEAIGIA